MDLGRENDKIGIRRVFVDTGVFVVVVFIVDVVVVVVSSFCLLLLWFYCGGFYWCCVEIIGISFAEVDVVTRVGDGCFSPPLSIFLRVAAKAQMSP